MPHIVHTASTPKDGHGVGHRAPASRIATARRPVRVAECCPQHGGHHRRRRRAPRATRSSDRAAAAPLGDGPLATAPQTSALGPLPRERVAADLLSLVPFFLFCCPFVLCWFCFVASCAPRTTRAGAARRALRPLCATRLPPAHTQHRPKRGSLTVEASRTAGGLLLRVHGRGERPRGRGATPRPLGRKTRTAAGRRTKRSSLFRSPARCQAMRFHPLDPRVSVPSCARPAASAPPPM